MRRLAPGLILLALALPAVAHASARQLRVFEDDRLLIYSGPQVRAATLDAAKQMGVDVIRAQFVWRNIALQKVRDPADPAAYGANWSNWDSLVIEAHKRGMRVLATVTGPAPAWEAGKTGKWFAGSRYPNARDFGAFMTAVGRRYSGSAKAAAVSASSAGVVRARSALFSDGLPSDPTTVLTDPTTTLSPTDPPPCVPLPPLVSCDNNGIVLPPPPGSGGGSGSGGGGSGSPPPPPPPDSGEESPPPPPGSGEPTPPPAPGTTLPRIDMWSIYNEPNHPLFLSPQRHKGVLTSPSLYRALYRAGWQGLARTGHARDTILIGETLPIGTNQDRETSATSPLTFARELFCLNGKGPKHPGCSGRFARLHASGWALHPYYRKTGPFSTPPGPNDLTPSRLGALRTLLVRASRSGRINRGLALWDTENGSQTRPPDPKGASLERQARFINEAEYLAWRTPYMRSFSQYLMVDEQPVWAFQSGLEFQDGKPKPALEAYRLPIYVKKAGKGAVVWGHIAAGGDGNVTILPAGQGPVVVHVPGASGYFTKSFATRASSYRLQYGPLFSRSAQPQ